MKTNNTAVASRAGNLVTPEWTSYACTSAACSGAIWLVQRVPGFDELWRLTDHVDASPWLVAASEPICPRCGSDLAASLELEREAQSAESALMHWMWR